MEPASTVTSTPAARAASSTACRWTGPSSCSERPAARCSGSPSTATVGCTPATTGTARSPGSIRRRARSRRSPAGSAVSTSTSRTSRRSGRTGRSTSRAPATTGPRSCGSATASPSGGATELVEYPNGMVVLPDGDAMLVIESHAQRIARVPIGADGSAGPATTFAELPDTDADGLALDADGYVWATLYRPDGLVRFGPDGNEALRIDDHLATTLDAPTNLAFAGADLALAVVANVGDRFLAAADLGVARARRSTTRDRGRSSRDALRRPHRHRHRRRTRDRPRHRPGVPRRGGDGVRGRHPRRRPRGHRGARARPRHHARGRSRRLRTGSGARARGPRTRSGVCTCS